jgi:transcription elongation factor Elf1
MLATQTCDITCPYCGETIQVIVDLTIQEQNYIEDCFVCCQPIQLAISIDHTGEAKVIAYHQNDC